MIFINYLRSFNHLPPTFPAAKTAPPLASRTGSPNEVFKSRSGNYSISDGSEPEQAQSTMAQPTLKKQFNLTAAEFLRSLRASQETKENFFGDDFDDEDYQMPKPMQQHDFVRAVRQSATKYRLKSAAHYDVAFSVAQTSRLTAAQLREKVTRSFKLEIMFKSFNHEVSAICGPEFIRKRGKLVQTKRIRVQGKERWYPLHSFLQVQFPPDSSPVSIEAMQAWWAAIGKVFQWSRLPDEIKVQILGYCVGPQVTPHMMKYRSPSPRIAFYGPWEFHQKLTHWRALLRVDHKVRSITLGLCFDTSTENGGIAIRCRRIHDLDETLDRLSQYPTLTGSQTLPYDEKKWEQATNYLGFPHLFPELSRFATFRHGLGKIHLSWESEAYMMFFAIDTLRFGDFYSKLKTVSRYPDLDYTVFETLPNLTCICATVYGDYKKRWFWTQPLLDKKKPCLRVLQRLIYERIADRLACYKNVHVFGLLDEEEYNRFDTYRQTAVQELLALNEPELKERAASGKDGLDLSPPDWEPRYRYLPEPLIDDPGYVAPECTCDLPCTRI